MKYKPEVCYAAHQKNHFMVSAKDSSFIFCRYCGFIIEKPKTRTSSVMKPINLPPMRDIIAPHYVVGSEYLGPRNVPLFGENTNEQPPTNTEGGEKETEPAQQRVGTHSLDKCWCDKIHAS